MMLALSTEFGQWGLEHQESSANGARPGYFLEWDKAIRSRWIIPHELSHAWNGKLRRPADLLTEHFNEPMRNSLLWVYEGLGSYLEWMLTARSGLATTEQSIDTLADMAARMTARPGHSWRNLQDTTSDSAIMSRRSTAWPDWQRGQDYYTEGALLWLDVDTRIREAGGDARSLDDFLRRFFGDEPVRHADGSVRPRPYTFEEVVHALQHVQPLDWAGFLRSRLDGNDQAPLDGINRGGWSRAWEERESGFARHAEVSTGSPGRVPAANFAYSLGLAIAPDGRLEQVAWGSPADKAGVTTRMTLVAVQMKTYRAERLAAALAANRQGAAPLELMLREDDIHLAKTFDWRSGSRRSTLRRNATAPDRLTEILRAR